MCGHSESCYCSDNATHINCSKLCEETLSCGHFCQNKCSQPCTYQCKVKVDKNLPCGHNVSDYCYINEDQIQCSHPCGALLDCEHSCTGTCFSCNMGRLHKGCTSTCSQILICGHSCDFLCTPSCPPCTKPCANFCTHSRCPKKCFEPCAPCMEPCNWSCPHFTCTQPCGIPCNRPPCNKPCDKRMKCRHLCIGLCGELCPKICRFCNKEAVTKAEILFGREDKLEEARFILLPDCNHTVEVEMLDQWMSDGDDNKPGSNFKAITVEKNRLDQDTAVTAKTTHTSVEPQRVTLKVCPKCKTPIRKCFRYGNGIKSKLKDVEAIKNIQLSVINSINLPLEFAKLKLAFNRDVSLRRYSLFAKEVKLIEKIIKKKSFLEEQTSTFFSYTVKAKISFLLQIFSTQKILNRIDCFTSVDYQEKIFIIKSCLKKTNEFIMQDFLSQQQLSDADSEIRRLFLFAKAIELQVKCKSKFFHLTKEESDYLAQIVSELETSGWKSKRLVKREIAILEEFESLGAKYSNEGLSKPERLEVVKKISLPNGHWYKCPNGHYYATGKCAGAMQRGQCPECKADIGGMSHALALP